MKKIILLAAILVTFMSGCKKKDDPEPKTTTQYLTAHPWKISGAVSNVAIDADYDDLTPNTTDLWAQSYDDCDKDNILTFSENGTGTFVDAGISCGSGTPSVFTWALSGSNTLILIQGDDTEIITLVSVDDNTLKISIAATNNGIDYIETDTFIKQ